MDLFAVREPIADGADVSADLFVVKSCADLVHRAWKVASDDDLEPMVDE